MLMLKLCSVATLFGGLIVLLVLVLAPGVPETPEAWRERTELLGRGFLRVVVPASMGAILAGLLLTASIWRVLIRMHWFLTKMVMVACGLPALHLFMRTRLLALRAEIATESPSVSEAVALWMQLLGGTTAGAMLVLAVMFLGRVKPRLGQDYGRSFAGSESRSAT